MRPWADAGSRAPLLAWAQVAKGRAEDGREPMGTKVAAAVLAGLAAVALTGCGEQYPGIVADKFAEGACNGWWVSVDAGTTAEQALANLTGTAQERRDAALAAVAALSQEVEVSLENLADGPPAVKDGAAIQKSFTDWYDAWQGAIDDGVGAFETATTGADAQTVSTQAALLAEAIGRSAPWLPAETPFQAMSDQDRQVYVDQPSCSSVSDADLPR